MTQCYDLWLTWSKNSQSLYMGSILWKKGRFPIPMDSHHFRYSNCHFGGYPPPSDGSESHIKLVSCIPVYFHLLRKKSPKTTPKWNTYIWYNLYIYIYYVYIYNVYIYMVSQFLPPWNPSFSSHSMAGNPSPGILGDDQKCFVEFAGEMSEFCEDLHKFLEVVNNSQPFFRSWSSWLFCWHRHFLLVKWVVKIAILSASITISSASILSVWSGHEWKPPTELVLPGSRRFQSWGLHWRFTLW